MSERATQTPAAAATEAAEVCLASRPGAGGSTGDAAGQSLADRAAQFREGAPFLVERASLYGALPREQSEDEEALPPGRSLLPAALTLLAVVVVAGLAAGVIFARNVDPASSNHASGRLEQFSERDLPAQGNPNLASGRTTVPYDLTRRPSDAIVGAWRQSEQAGKQSTPSDTAMKPSAPAVERPRRALPRRLVITPPSAQDAPVATETASPERITPPDADLAKAQPPVAEVPKAQAAEAGKSAPNIVARVGREAEPEETGDDKSIGTRKVRRERARPASDDDEAEGHGSRLGRYRALRERARKRARTLPDPYDAFLTEKAAQGIRFYGVHRQSP